MSAWDYSEGHDCIRLLCQYLNELLTKPEKEQYVLTNIRQCDLPKVIDEQLIIGSKYIQHIKIEETSIDLPKYMVIFERNKADN